MSHHKSPERKALHVLNKRMLSVTPKCEPLGKPPQNPTFCAGCPIQPECYEYGKQNPSATGVWGGVDWRPELEEND